VRALSILVFKIIVFNALQRDLALLNILLSKQPFKMQLQIEIEDVTQSPQYTMPATRIQA
jgi:hypothetical protein